MLFGGMLSGWTGLEGRLDVNDVNIFSLLHSRPSPVIYAKIIMHCKQVIQMPSIYFLPLIKIIFIYCVLYLYSTLLPIHRTMLYLIVFDSITFSTMKKIFNRMAMLFVRTFNICKVVDPKQFVIYV